jgi:hypothetical protein
MREGLGAGFQGILSYGSHHRGLRRLAIMQRTGISHMPANTCKVHNIGINMHIFIE